MQHVGDQHEREALEPPLGTLEMRLANRRGLGLALTLTLTLTLTLALALTLTLTLNPNPNPNLPEALLSSHVEPVLVEAAAEGEARHLPPPVLRPY